MQFSCFRGLICILIPFAVKVAMSYGWLRVNKFQKELTLSIGLEKKEKPRTLSSEIGDTHVEKCHLL